MSSAKRTFALPLMLLALLLQGMAPGVAAAMTARMLDPFADLPICSSDLNGAEIDHAPSPQDHGKAACAACVVCEAPATLIPEAPPLAPQPAAVAPIPPAIAVAGPRGPPRIVPQARGPPTRV